MPYISESAMQKINLDMIADDDRIAALEKGIADALINLYAVRIMESQKRNALISERYSFTNPADANEVEAAINRLDALLKS